MIKIESNVGMGDSIKTETWSMRCTAMSGESKWDKDTPSQRRVRMKGLKKERTQRVMTYLFDAAVC